MLQLLYIISFLKHKFLDFLSSSADIILPAVCVNCRTEVSGSSLLCLRCSKSIIIRKTPRKIGSHLLFAATDYKDPSIRSLIKIMKYSGISKAGEPLADIILRHLEISEFKNIIPSKVKIFIIPVPIHFLKKWQRGFNQSEILADIIGQKLNIPVVSALKRQKWTISQSELTDDRVRSLNIENCFSLSRQATLIPYKSILIILDDVVTSGETIKEAAKILRSLLPVKIIFVSISSR